METKQDIRKKVFALRKAADPAQIVRMSRQITEQLISTAAWKKARWIYAYMDCKHEVMTGEILEEAWKQGKRTAVPRVTGADLVFYEITSAGQCENGYFGILEPPETLPAASCEDALLLVPGVAFDKDLHRVGYGKGFYDRYFSVHQEHIKAALAFSWQIFDQVPWEANDISPDFLITESGLIGK